MQDVNGMKPRRKQATVIVLPNGDLSGMVFEHCSSTTIESRRWQKAVQLILCSETHVVGSQLSCCRHRGIRP